MIARYRHCLACCGEYIIQVLKMFRCNVAVKGINKLMNTTLLTSSENSDPTSYTYTFDQLGGSFKSYVLNNNAPEALAKLKHGMDELSCAYIDYCLESALQFPDLRLRHLFGRNKNLNSCYYPQWMIEDVKLNISRNPPVAVVWA